MKVWTFPPPQKKKREPFHKEHFIMKATIGIYQIPVGIPASDLGLRENTAIWSLDCPALELPISKRWISLLYMS